MKEQMNRRNYRRVQRFRCGIVVWLHEGESWHCVMSEGEKR